MNEKKLPKSKKLNKKRKAKLNNQIEVII